ncbi:hypothetical protein Salat_1188600 [Sesamum alatum]|uniref:Uncharacterized protein n=1 Tax=Sesamum alatum TaxID=300844 RepID=A0AAE1YF37_9LAMI|nr:hypothetical protein Salat_1188600 [Sesamum alatum]
MPAKILEKCLKAILCNCDQALLGRHLHTKIEKYFAHCMIQACAFGHNLCSAFRKDKKALVSINATLKSEVEALEFQLSEMKASNDEKVVNLEAQLQRYLASNEHTTLLAATRIEAAHDFLKSAAFGISLEINTARSTIDAFKLCRSQIKTLGGFVECFAKIGSTLPWMPSYKFLMWANLLLLSLPQSGRLNCSSDFGIMQEFNIRGFFGP